MELWFCLGTCPRVLCCSCCISSRGHGVPRPLSVRRSLVTWPRQWHPVRDSVPSAVDKKSMGSNYDLILGITCSPATTFVLGFVLAPIGSSCLNHDMRVAKWWFSAESVPLVLWRIALSPLTFLSTATSLSSPLLSLPLSFPPLPKDCWVFCLVNVL